MAIFVNDTFTEAADLALESHTGETGATWVKHPSYTGNLSVISLDGRVQHVDSNTAGYYASGAPAGNEYTVDYDFKINAASNAAAGVIARVSTSANTFYHLRYNDNINTWQLYETISGTFTLIVSLAQNLVIGQFYAVKLTITDASKEFSIDGGAIQSSSNNNITANGSVGVRFYGLAADQNDCSIDNLSATDIGGAAAAGIPIFRRRITARQNR